MIDDRAIVDPSASIHKDAMISAFSIIDGGVEIGAGSWVGPHVVIRGSTKIGKNNKIFQFASIGEAPQDKKYADEETQLHIGDNNVIREYASIHRGTVQDEGVTRVGNNNLLMANVHVAHDCQLKDNLILANHVTLGGHVVIDDWAILGGFTGVHQFCHIGAHVFTSINSMITKDVPPFLMASGQKAIPRGLNSEGLKRREFSTDAIAAIKRAYKIIYRSDLTIVEAVSQIEEQYSDHQEVKLFIDFISNSSRGIIR